MMKPMTAWITWKAAMISSPIWAKLHFIGGTSGCRSVGLTLNTTLSSRRRQSGAHRMGTLVGAESQSRGVGADQRQHGDSEQHRYDGGGKRERISVALCQAFLYRQVERREQIPQLVGDAGIEPTNGIRRQFGQVCRDDAPGALDHHLHQERAEAQHRCRA